MRIFWPVIVCVIADPMALYIIKVLENFQRLPGKYRTILLGLI